MIKINTVWWNKIRYTIYAPIYDRIAKFSTKSRKQSIESLQLIGNEKVLIIGAGTGLDLEFIPGTCHVTATDITPAMVVKSKARAEKLGMSIDSLVMNGQSLEFNDELFDVIILHLILAVIPDPVKCIMEAERVLKKNGRIVIYDKFVKEGHKVSLFRKVLNKITTLLATDITRSFAPIISNTKLEIVHDIPADFSGNFRRIMVKKSQASN